MLHATLFLLKRVQLYQIKEWEDVLDSETATPAAYLGSKLPEEEEQEEEVQGEEDDYDTELEDDYDSELEEDDILSQKALESALEKFDKMTDFEEEDSNENEEETTDSEEGSTSDEDDGDRVDEDRKCCKSI